MTLVVCVCEAVDDELGDCDWLLEPLTLAVCVWLGDCDCDVVGTCDNDDVELAVTVALDDCVILAVTVWLVDCVRLTDCDWVAI